MFIIVNAFDAFAHIRDPAVRAQKALKKCGMTVTLTSLTNCVVFLFGVTFSYPAVQYFCVYAAVAIFVDYLLQVTLFVNFVVRDLQRQEERLQGGNCAAFCPTRCLAGGGGRFEGHKGVAEEGEDFSTRTSLPTNEAASVVSPSCCARPLLTAADLAECRRLIGTSGEDNGNANEGQMKNFTWLFAPFEEANFRPFIKRYYAPCVTGPLVTKIAIVLLFFGYCGFSLYCVTQVTKDFEIKDLTPDDSYFRDMLTVTETLYTQSGKGRLGFGMYYKHGNHHDLTMQSLMYEHETSVRQLQYVEGDEISSWFADFRGYHCGTAAAQPPVANVNTLTAATAHSYTAAGYAPCAALQSVSTDAVTFGTAVHDWLQLPFSQMWKDDVIITGSAGSGRVVRFSRVHFRHSAQVVKPGKDAVNANKEIFRFADEQKARGIVVDASTLYYQFFDQTWHIQEELTRNYIFAVVGVLLVTMLVMNRDQMVGLPISGTTEIFLGRRRGPLRVSWGGVCSRCEKPKKGAFRGRQTTATLCSRLLTSMIASP